MAAYAPADALVYLECNSLLDLGTAITGTDAWHKLAPPGMGPVKDGWSTFFVRNTGIGPTASVIASRAQLAFVVLDLTTLDRGNGLEYQAPMALLIETHTIESRVKSLVEKMANDFATHALSGAKRDQLAIDGSQVSRWMSADGRDQVLAVADGSLAIIGNDQKAISACLAVHRGQRAGMLHRPELERMRAQVGANSGDSLSFGFISAANATKLITAGAPKVLGPLLQQEQFKRLISNGASKFVGDIGWSSHTAKGGIEDRYFIQTRPEILSGLKSGFVPTQVDFGGAWDLLPPHIYSVTSYNMRVPADAWSALGTTVSAQLDVVSAVLFTTTFKELLGPYDIDDPETFLKAIQPDLLTVRMESQSERALVIAGIASPDDLRKFVGRRFGPNPRSEKIGASELFISADEDFAASFAGDFFLLGSPDDVRRSLSTRESHKTIATSSSALESVSHFLDKPTSAPVITFVNESDRAVSVVNTITALRGSAVDQTSIDRAARELPYSVTETEIGSAGFQRRTRSNFGIFGYLLTSFARPSTNRSTQQ